MKDIGVITDNKHQRHSSGKPQTVDSYSTHILSKLFMSRRNRETGEIWKRGEKLKGD